MSAKSTKKAKKSTTPRALEEIKSEYGKLCVEAGQIQYQIKIYSKNLDELNKKLETINYEASARNQMDSLAAQAQANTELTKTNEGAASVNNT